MTTQTQSMITGAAHLRGATMADLEAVQALLRANDLPLDGVAAVLESFVVAEAGERIVGVAGLEACCHNALLRSVAVDAEWRSRGLGRALVTRVIADAEARGIRALYLLTTSAEQYFPSFGFRTIARDAVPDDVRATDEFRSACPATAIVMECQLERCAT